jgi:hypothetical protein
MNNQSAQPVGLETGKEPELPGRASDDAGALPARDRRRLKKKRRWSPPEDRRLIHLFWGLVVPMLGYVAYTWADRPADYSFAALLVAFFALLPAYLWCGRVVMGLPIFPFFAGTYLLTYAYPFVLAEPSLREHPNESIRRAAWTVSGFLLLATLVWLFWVRRARPLPTHCRVLSADRGTTLLLMILVVGVIVTVFDHADWLAGLPGGLVTLIRQFFHGPTAFAIFVLALRWGKRSLSPGQISIFIGLFMALCIADTSSIFLVTAIISSLMLVLGFIIGRETVPWSWLTPLIVLVGFLHIGKFEMRARYWAEGVQGNTLQPWAYPAFYAEWLQCSSEQLISQKHGGDEQASIFSRVNILYLLLEAQEMAPREVPFLKGETYAIIPSALVPRLINSEKASPHYSTTLLNVTFGNQTEETAQSTSIGWGLLNEAYANFGYTGCGMLAVILGTFYGLITRWSIGLPPASLPTLVGIFTLSFALQTEMTAAIYITAYLQGLFALLVLVYFFTERISLRPGSGQSRKTK